MAKTEKTYYVSDDAVEFIKKDLEYFYLLLCKNKKTNSSPNKITITIEDGKEKS